MGVYVFGVFFSFQSSFFHLRSSLQGKGWEVRCENRLGAEADLYIQIEHLILLESPKVQN